MTVKDLKEKLSSMPDHMEVLIPMSPMEGFDGLFFSPCVEETGEIVMGKEEIDDEEIGERKLLGKEVPEEKCFVLVPCGFYNKEHDGSVELN